MPTLERRDAFKNGTFYLRSGEDARDSNLPSLGRQQVARIFGVPYGSRPRVAAVKENGPIVIQSNLAAWIALYRSSRTHGYAYWTFNGPCFPLGISADFVSRQRILSPLESAS